jgi:hypothetical protein
MSLTSNTLPLKVGAICSSGQAVAIILGQSHKACCYTTEDNHIRWEFYPNDGMLPSELVPVVARFDTLLWEIANHIPKPFRKAYYHRAGQALFSSLDCQDASKADGFFSDLECAIRDSKLGMTFYLLSGFMGFLTLGCACYWMYRFNETVPKEYILSGFCGTSGAFASLLQRAGRLEAFPNAIRLLLVMQGASRVLLGFIFGSALCLFMNGQLVLGFMGGKQEVIYALGFIAGISERFFPEITDAVSARTKKENEG